MYKNVRELYRSLTADQKSEFLSWASERYGMKATSIKNHWMYNSSVPDDYKDEVLAKLEELSK